jgi:hypothetical protein
MSYDYLGDLEREWLSKPLDLQILKNYEQIFGTENLQLMLNCDRELAFGYIQGCNYARTPLREMVEGNGELRWRYLVGVLDYYFTKFRQEKPDLIFFNEFTMTYEVVAHFVAKQLGIPCYCGFISRFGDVYIPTSILGRRYSPVNQLYLEAQSQKSVLQPEKLKASQEYLRKFRERPDLPMYSVHFQAKALRLGRFSSLVRNLVVDSVKWAAIVLGLKGTRGFLRQRNGWDLLKQNFNIFRSVRAAIKGKNFEDPGAYINEPYVFYPLHVEPESSTLVEANKISNQLMVIEQISKGLPAGYQLLVKEHVPMLGLRPKGFYETIRRMPNVHLISPFAENFNLLKKSKATVVITGTAGWESLFMGRPTILLGETEFSILDEGFVQVQSVTDFGSYLRKALIGPPVSEAKLEMFVAACLQEGIHLPVSAYAYAHYGTDGKAMMKKYSEAVSEIVGRILKMMQTEPGMRNHESSEISVGN